MSSTDDQDSTQEPLTDHDPESLASPLSPPHGYPHSDNPLAEEAPAMGVGSQNRGVIIAGVLISLVIIVILIGLFL